MAKTKKFFRLHASLEKDGSYLESPTGHKLYIKGDQSFITVIKFVDEVNALKPSLQKAYDKHVNKYIKKGKDNTKFL